MQNSNYKAKSVVEAGLNIALIVVIMLMSAYVPPFLYIGIFLLPIPITVLYMRNNLRISIAAVIMSAVLIAILVDPFVALRTSTLYGLTGLILGICIKRKIKYSHTIVLLTASATVGMTVSILVLVYLMLNTDIVGFVNLITKTLSESQKMAYDFYVGAGVSKEQADATLKMMGAITPELLLSVFPAMIVVTAFLSAFANYAMTKAVLKKLKYEMLPMTPFSMIYIDNRIGAVVIAFTCLGIILSSRGIKAGNYIMNSSVYILQMLFLLVGASVITYFLKNRFNLKKGFIIFIIIFTIMNPSFSAVYFGIGFADMLIDFRKVDPNRLFKRKSDK